MASGARTRRSRLVALGTVGLLAGTMIVGCGDDDDSASADTDDTASTTSLVPLTTPPTTSPTTTTTLPQYYEVQPGDTLSGIAQNFDIRLEDLVAANGITDPNQIRVGEKLLLPPPTVLVNPDGSTTVAPTAAAADSTTSSSTG